jgi:hypothetical protein
MRTSSSRAIESGPEVVDHNFELSIQERRNVEKPMTKKVVLLISVIPRVV